MEVNVTKCLNGHYYDANKYENCPHCGAVSCVGSKTLEEEKKEKKRDLGFFQKKKRNKAEVVSPEFWDVVARKVGLFTDISEKMETKSMPATHLVEVEEIVELPSMDAVVEDDDITYGKFIEKRTDVVDKPEEISLFQEVKSVTGNNDSKTMGFFRMGSSDEMLDSSEEIEPVCGWLVCVRGRYLGRAYDIYAGSNSIGRNNSNRIAINDEESISREKHAWVIYEPRKREFFLKPGESRGLTYHNEENILEAVKIKTGDKIELGDVAFVFVALCGTDFSWENFVVEGK